MFNPVQVFHLGTIAFGSLILAIIRTIRTILEYAEKKCKKFNNDLTRLAPPVFYASKKALPCLSSLQVSSEMLPVLPLVSGEVHEVSQQERLHHVRCQGLIIDILLYPTYFFFVEHKLLHIRQGRLQPADEEPGAGGGAGQCGRLPPLPWQDRDRPAHWRRLLPCLCRPHP